MPTEYQSVNLADMQTLFQEDHGWIEDTIRNEKVFEYELKKLPGIKILVYTSVSVRGRGRGKGKDAIRVCAIDSYINKGLRKTPHIKRTANWQGRIKDRVKELIQDLYADPILEARIKKPNPV